jgi:hypothetical protein
MDLAPDLLLVGAEGFNLQSGLKAESLLGQPLFTGKHTQHDAFMLVKDLDGQDLARDRPGVTDLLAIISRIKGGEWQW